MALIEKAKDLDILCAVGMPVASNGALYNCAAVFCRGALLALPAKQNVPNYSGILRGAPLFARARERYAPLHGRMVPVPRRAG